MRRPFSSSLGACVPRNTSHLLPLDDPVNPTLLHFPPFSPTPPPREHHSSVSPTTAPPPQTSDFSVESQQFSACSREVEGGGGQVEGGIHHHPPRRGGHPGKKQSPLGLHAGFGWGSGPPSGGRSGAAPLLLRLSKTQGVPWDPQDCVPASRSPPRADRGLQILRSCLQRVSVGDRTCGAVPAGERWRWREVGAVERCGDRRAPAPLQGRGWGGAAGEEGVGGEEWGGSGDAGRSVL